MRGAIALVTADGVHAASADDVEVTPQTDSEQVIALAIPHGVVRSAPARDAVGIDRLEALRPFRSLATILSAP